MLHLINQNIVFISAILFLIVSSPVYLTMMSQQSEQIMLFGQAVAHLQEQRVGVSDTASTSARHPGPISSSPMAIAPFSTASDTPTFKTQLASADVGTTNDIVGVKAYYDILFTTITNGTIKTIQMKFPPDTVVDAQSLIEAMGIGPGSVSSSGLTVNYTVANAVPVPTGTAIRIQLANITNPTHPAGNYPVTITTIGSDNNIIDGPTQTSPYPVKQIDTSQIADGAVTQAKISRDEINVVWTDTTSGNYHIFHRSNGNIDFQPPVGDLSNYVTLADRPAIAASGSNVYVVWKDNNAGNREIFYKRSTNGGASFGSAINLSNNPELSDSPAISASGNNVYVVWEDRSTGYVDIFYKRSTNGGASFGSTVNLSKNHNDAAGSQPAIAASGNNVYVVWYQSPSQLPHAPTEIYFKRSTNAGESFFFFTADLSFTPGGSYHPALATSGNNVYVVWEDRSTVQSDILYRRSSDGGANFGSTVNLSNNTVNSFSPSISASGNNTYIVWEDDYSPLVHSDILYRRSSDEGSNFGSTVNLSNNTLISLEPAIAAFGNNLYIVWVDGTSGNYDILYRRSSEEGSNFGSTVNLSNNAGSSLEPAIAAINNIP